MTAFLLRHRVLWGVLMAAAGIVGLLLGEVVSGLIMLALGVAWLVAVTYLWPRSLDRRLARR